MILKKKNRLYERLKGKNSVYGWLPQNYPSAPSPEMVLEFFNDKKVNNTRNSLKQSFYLPNARKTNYFLNFFICFLEI